MRGASTGIFYGKGEVCAAGSRILVEDAVYDEFVSAFAERAAKMTVGDPQSPKTRLGAIVSEEQLERVLGYIEAGKAKAVRKQVNFLCGEVRGEAGALVDAFGIPDALLAAPIAT